MIILGFESTAKIASVALLDENKTLASYSIDNGLTQSELLLPMAESALKSLKLGFDDVSLFAASVGPGSFTGVRIGVSIVKGLSFGKNKKTVAVSTLEALAENLSGISGVIVPVMDARRNQVYTALFRGTENGTARISEDAAISIDELCSMLLDYKNEDIYLVGDGYELVYESLKGKVPLKTTPRELRLQSAASVCRVAKRYFDRGETVSDIEICPVYLRLAQAERERLERENLK
jgi:tRNA threonylcarbamoyladenosine biosynthesis protein TsaB